MLVQFEPSNLECKKVREGGPQFIVASSEIEEKGPLHHLHCKTVSPQHTARERTENSKKKKKTHMSEK